MLPWLVAVAFFMESLDTTILNTAVPVIAKALVVAEEEMERHKRNEEKKKKGGAVKDIWTSGPQFYLMICCCF